MQRRLKAQRKQRLWPIRAPGMAPVGADILAEAGCRGDEKSRIELSGKKVTEHIGPAVRDVLREALYGRGELMMNFTVKRDKKLPLRVISGHVWGRDPNGPSAGPEPARVMIIGKNLGDVEVEHKRCQRGKAGQLLLQSLMRLGVRGVGDWYVTNVLKTENPGEDRGQLNRLWVLNQRHLLDQELRLVKPDYILCLGADATKVVLGKDMTLSKLEGRVVEYELPIGRKEGDDAVHKILVMSCVHPAAVLSTPELAGKFERALARFYQLTKGERWDQHEQGLDHRVIDNEPDLLTLCEEMERDCAQEGFGPIIAIDAEWHGEHPQNAGAYVRTIQVSWAHKKAACIVLRHAGGSRAFRGILRDKHGQPVTKVQVVIDEAGRRVKQNLPVLTTKHGIKQAISVLRKFLQNKRVAGHQFCSDLEWLIPLGLDLRKQFAAPADWRDARLQGGLDTALMAHAFNETDDFTLTGQTLRYTEAPRYDLQLKQWIRAHCKHNKLKESQLKGFGDCPDKVLHSYAVYDADVSRRLAIHHIKMLDCDEFGNNCWEPYWLSLRAALPVLEINCTGLLLNNDRVDELTQLYMISKAKLGQQVRDWARWPELNLESRFHVAELLFGEKYNGHPLGEDGRPRRLRPKKARTIRTLPVLTTDKRPKQWSEVIEAGAEADHTASTNKQVLGILRFASKQLPIFKPKENKWVTEDHSEIITALRDYRFISHVLKGVLRTPDSGEEGFIEDDEGNWVYSAGVAGSVCSDNRVRTFMSQLKETGRYASARPPLQNCSKRREADYARILGDDYRYPLRSIFEADPEHLLLEVDYKGAELYGMAMMAGDPVMLKHVKRNLLPEDHPNYYDIHSNIACRAFRLDCEPTKAGLKSIGKAHFRILAKAVA